jgi:glycine cleavage system aminomethyltransferase T
VLAAGAPFGIEPYGLDALNTLRIEKGHVTGAEMNGNTSAAMTWVLGACSSNKVISSAACCRSAPA